MTRLRFTKMHGIGNDYVYVDCFAQSVPDPADLAVPNGQGSVFDDSVPAAAHGGDPGPDPQAVPHGSLTPLFSEDRSCFSPWILDSPGRPSPVLCLTGAEAPA